MLAIDAAFDGSAKDASGSTNAIVSTKARMVAGREVRMLR
jgi:hypothetical protein